MSQSTIPVTFSANVPALPDNNIWFANSAAWSNYWLDGVFSANLPVADTSDYGLVKQANTTAYAAVALTDTAYYTLQLDLLGTGVLTNVSVPSLATTDNLVAVVKTLATNYQLLITALLNAGIINN